MAEHHHLFLARLALLGKESSALLEADPQQIKEAVRDLAPFQSLRFAISGQIPAEARDPRDLLEGSAVLAPLPEDPPRNGIATSCSGCGKGAGLRTTPWSRLKMAVLAPMPSASMSTVSKVKAGLFRSRRKA
jgi:hypothetical protein